MSVREQIFNISDLIFSDEKVNMSPEKWNIYLEKLNIFVTSFPTKETMLKASLTKKDFENVIKHLSDIVGLLQSIYAFDLAEDCKKRLNSFNKNKPEKLEAYVIFLISNITYLSIDIQMALSNKIEALVPHSPLDTFIDMGNSSIGSELPIETIEPTEIIEKKEKRFLKNIIAVDDEPFCLHTLKASLNHLACNIITVNSSKAALNLLNNIKPDLFILDIDMPDIDGIELAKILKRQGQAAPIIFLTGNATRECVNKCIHIGASDFIAKPIYSQNVAKRIERFL